ncbi:hypothetical protein G6F37_011963 [Rhizopus arrhizus]|nr:hypothetical protein G6F37_011963 [Rhizopus arrhizus]KAG1146961.1 hypothetical protein G6F38_004576 [Rhizopus arrhizus]
MDLDTIRQALNAIAYSRSNRNMRSSYQQGRQQVRCFGCQGYGHIKSECPTWRKNGSDNRRGGRFTRNNMNIIESTKKPRSPNTTLSRIIRWPTICRILYDLDYLYYAKIPPIPPTHLGQRLLE